MAYAVKQDLIDRYGEAELIQLTDRASLGIIDDTVLGQAIGDAAAEIDGYLSGRYQLPLASVPSVLVRIACDIARYRLYDQAAAEQVTKRYDDAVAMLRSIAKGELSLGTDGASAPTVANTAQIESAGSVFSRDKR
ncbi:gp436 family protein [Methylogaea oryzae]|uniref:DUF1320 domain-containing protein n=1 Tax=Methylogaea oryzae TaxID=1295382 RepID=A0A8D5AHJ4_9GAMM|nr:phage protein Gp36 family protein [Methylogaea oryzae]BBL70331.1 hypothetical protein MoryE10_09370 [Methylogaea oryzae]